MVSKIVNDIYQHFDELDDFEDYLGYVYLDEFFNSDDFNSVVNELIAKGVAVSNITTDSFRIEFRDRGYYNLNVVNGIYGEIFFRIEKHIDIWISIWKKKEQEVVVFVLYNSFIFVYFLYLTKKSLYFSVL